MRLKYRTSFFLLLVAGIVPFGLPILFDTDANLGQKQKDGSSTPGSNYLDEDSQDSAEWVVKLAPNLISNNLWSWQSDEQKANKLAEELGMENLGQVEPFPGVFRFRHHLSGWTGSKPGSEGGSEVGKRSVEAVDILLEEHGSLVWSKKEVAIVRKKRTNYLQLNDPMFNKQWHLVSFFGF